MAEAENKSRVLVIDDEPFVLKILVRQLANLGFLQVIPCESALDARAVLGNEQEPVDLIFCDLQMPVMDGIEFLRHLVHVGYAGGLVLVSGENERILQTAERLAAAHKLNVLGALHKPVSPDALRKVLEGKIFGTGTLRLAVSPGKGSLLYGPEELREAMARGELVNFYQPKVAVATCAVTGVEALVRWRHPRDGLVFPDQFIQMAEDNGLIDDLMRVVLVTALRHCRQWQNAGLHTHVAVNVSMLSLTAIDFPDIVNALVVEAGVPTSSLVLEVTESKLMRDPLSSLDILTRLRLKGIGVSIDDFGTGHSSLAQLRDLPFSELKIDRGFVHGAWHDASLKAIFDASLNMALQLGITTVAEGVEDRADWNFLRTAKCDTAQGYFIAKPMSAAELSPNWIADWEDRDLGASVT